jgi:hypothetical protein
VHPALASNPSRPRVRLPNWVAWLVAALALAALAITALLIFLPPAAVPGGTISHSDEARLVAENSVRATILQFAAGIVLIFGLCLTARTVYLSRETHLTDRFTKAVEQLGHERREVRVGGIYALERLARNSVGDRHLVVEVITAYLHINAGLEEEQEPPRHRPSADVQTALTVLAGL